MLNNTKIRMLVNTRYRLVIEDIIFVYIHTSLELDSYRLLMGYQNLK